MKLEAKKAWEQMAFSVVAAGQVAGAAKQAKLDKTVQQAVEQQLADAAALMEDDPGPGPVPLALILALALCPWP